MKPALPTLRVSLSALLLFAAFLAPLPWVVAAGAAETNLKASDTESILASKGKAVVISGVVDRIERTASGHAKIWFLEQSGIYGFAHKRTLEAYPKWAASLDPLVGKEASLAGEIVQFREELEIYILDPAQFGDDGAKVASPPTAFGGAAPKNPEAALAALEAVGFRPTPPEGGATSGTTMTEAKPLRGPLAKPDDPVALSFVLYRMEGSLADSFQTRLLQGGNEAALALAKMPGLVSANRVKLMAQARFSGPQDANHDQKAAGPEFEKTADGTIFEGLTIHASPSVVAMNRIQLVVSAEFAETKSGEPGKPGVLTNLFMNAFLNPEEPFLAARWRRGDDHYCFLVQSSLNGKRAWTEPGLPQNGLYEVEIQPPQVSDLEKKRSPGQSEEPIERSSSPVSRRSSAPAPAKLRSPRKSPKLP